MQPPLPPSLPTIVPVSAYSPAQSSPTSHPSLLGLAPTSPVNISQTPPLSVNTPALMTSTPIGVAIQSPMPMLYPQAQTEPTFQPQPIQPQPIQPEQTQPPIEPAQIELYAYQIKPTFQTQSSPIEPAKIEPYTVPTEPLSQNTILDINYDENLIASDLEQGELYAEYLTNPYNESKEVTCKGATFYDPESPIQETINPLLAVLDKQKSFSANVTPQHTVKAQFGSSDNVRHESSIFNFSSYFGAVNDKSGGEFDSLMPAQEG
ncbi:Golgi-specific brefeldin a-resistance factor [Operophtera brumata]|uniref:Golgi-specific brefeldin a-resistance factor n=1 Tax=Operophtera brumata TaxID=104452 RepID=A0A0L7LKE1_OPEBR|nr:Golgi-specific brefeldin a-resistance factor [Operophtera brumata]